MKIPLILLLAISLLSQYYCQLDGSGEELECVVKTDPSNEKDCTSLKAGPLAHKCCLHEYNYKLNNGDKKDQKMCLPVVKEAYDKIKDYVEGLEKIAETSSEVKSVDVSVKCNSNYIFGSILSLIILLL